MRVPLSWLREYAPVEATGREVAERLIRAGFEVEHVERVGGDVTNVVVGQVLDVEELTGFKKPIRYVRLDLGHKQSNVVCGATNFNVGDRVAVAVPGAVLPGDFKISARETYGRTSEGMICSARELGIGDDHAGILVLDPDAPLGQDAVEVLGLSDEVLDIAVTPDRGYAFSIRGVAREAATAFGVEFTDPGVMPVPSGGEAHPVAIEDRDGCRRYVARVVRDVSPLAPTPFWLRQRITMAGMRPISLAVDVTNYVLLDVGQPLHAFDLAKLSGGIVVRRATAGERLTTLDGTDRALDPEDLVIADGSGAIAIAGVMGGASTEVSGETRDVLVESAWFAPAGIGRTSRRHLLSSEASKRFERGVDPELAPVAAERAVALLTSLAGGTADPGVTDVADLPSRPVITMSAGEPGRRAGVPYAREVVERRLAQVGCTVSGTDPLTVVPPSWRPDLTLPVDLTEEVMRLEGYDEIPPSLPPAPAGRGLTRRQRLVRRLGRALADAGWAEVVPYPFMAPESLDALLVPEGDERRRAPRIANPVSDAEPLLATTLLPGLLASLTRNVGRGLSDVALFQVVPVAIAREDAAAAPRPGVDVRPDDATLQALDAVLPRQPLHVGAVLTGLREPRGHWGPGRAGSWEDAVELVRLAARTLNARVEVRAGDMPPWHSGRCAEVLSGGEVVGWAGELHPRVCAALDLPPRTCAVEVDLEPLLVTAVEHVTVPPLSTHPPAYVDVALVVPGDSAAADVEAALRSGAGETLEDIGLFDVYTGLGEGRKSLAYRLTFRSPSGSLTSEEVNAMRDAAVAEAAARTGAMLRGA
ncbi:MAG TPA: phenylalanine--tRNA ligase subunit beta [Frankiaceae bacterium]|jgi:phenylalanyl-tRNA synthetase beta chain|nr:phenylalanine--tRNA ligase subunit beta [Frankiaceae bacterium]